MKLTDVVTVKEYADAHGLDVTALRRYIRKNEPDWAVKWGSIYVIDADAPVPNLEATTRKPLRKDGRNRFVVYASRDEIATIAAMLPEDCIVDPRQRARQRRIDRKSK